MGAKAVVGSGDKVNDAEYSVAACWSRFYQDAEAGFETWDNWRCKIRDIEGRRQCPQADECLYLMLRYGVGLLVMAERTIRGQL